jgi:hypothetical protein
VETRRSITDRVRSSPSPHFGFRFGAVGMLARRLAGDADIISLDILYYKSRPLEILC